MVSGQRNPGVLLETWNSLTPPDQVRVLLHAVEGGTSQSREALNQIFSNLEPAFEAGKLYLTHILGYLYKTFWIIMKPQSYNHIKPIEV